MSGKVKTKSPWAVILDSTTKNATKSLRKLNPAASVTVTKMASPASTSSSQTTPPTPSSLSATTAITVDTNNSNNLNNTNNSNNNSKTKTTTLKTTTTKTTTKTKSSASILVVRPKTLNVNRDEQHAETKIFIGEALNAWRAKARCSVVPAERLQELFQELQFYPSEKQISEMLQTAKVFARKGSKQLNGLTFGEFCVLAADLKRFRMCNFSSDPKTLSYIPNTPDINNFENCSEANTKSLELENSSSGCSSSSSTSGSHLLSPPSLIIGSTTITTTTVKSDSGGPEVFLGGSCNPTTWRADVAIPTLQKLGISFYNPQVSDWTPDLIELEHRAKEKARVLFFVMDSETRASAGAIEAAHIAGQNARQLVLVLHPYKPDQCILNEPITPQEYLDLTRNQQLLQELVMRRGLPVLDNIPSGLHRTKQILAGIRDPPSNIASVLLVVRGAFNRVVNSVGDEITMEQCQRALSLLGYANSILSTENLKSVVLSQRDSLENCSSTTMARRSMSSSSCSSPYNLSTNKQQHSSKKDAKDLRINFDEFCVLAAYLSVLQQEIHESGCISPIKGTNLPPPPIFLANMQEDIRNGDECVTITTSYSKQILRTSSCTSVPDDRHNLDLYRNRDSGTSSPQPLETAVKSKYIHIGKRSKISFNMEFMANGDLPGGSSGGAAGGGSGGGDESDSNDSVFSSGSSINSNFCDSFTGLEFRDVYLGGSCYLRTKWRQEYAIPYLQSKGITYHLPSLHESIPQSYLDGFIKNGSDDKLLLNNGQISQKLQNKFRTKRKDCSPINKNTQENVMADIGGAVAAAAATTITDDDILEDHQGSWPLSIKSSLFNPALLDSSRVLLFVITNETRSLAPMTLAAHCIGLMYNVVLCVQMLPDFCIIGDDRLTPTAIKDYNRGRSYLIDLAKRQGVPVFNDLKLALECVVEKAKACNCRNSV